MTKLPSVVVFSPWAQPTCASPEASCFMPLFPCSLLLDAIPLHSADTLVGLGTLSADILVHLILL